MNTQSVFVYGTLRRGGSNHFRMEASDFLGSGEISGRMWKIDWYPILICGGDTTVRGELYRVSEDSLESLDEFEGINPDSDKPREYRRVKISVTMDSGGQREAWVWEWAGTTALAEPLDGDDWLAFEPTPR